MGKTGEAFAEFAYGAPLEHGLLFDRKEEIRRIVERVSAIKVSARNDIVLVGPRRVGKSSLLNYLEFELGKKGFFAVKMDCEGHDLVSFLRSYGNAVVAASLEDKTLARKFLEGMRKGFAEAVTALAELLGLVSGVELKLGEFLKLRIEFEKTLAGRPLNEQEIESLAEKTLALPETLGGKFVLLFDEFQETSGFKLHGKGFHASLRRITQNQKNAVYVFTGSAVGMIRDIFGNPSNPLAGNAEIMAVKPFSKEITFDFLEKRFSRAGRRPGGKAKEFVFQVTGGFPSYLNWLGLSMLQSSKMRELGLKEAQEAFEKMFSPMSPIYQMIERQVAKLGGKTKKILAAVAAGRKKPSEIAKYAGTKNAYVYLDRLEKYGMLEQTKEKNYEFCDPVMKEYYARSVLR